MKKYFFNFTNNQIVQQPNYQPTNETISECGFRISECLFFQDESSVFGNQNACIPNSRFITYFFGTNLIKKNNDTTKSNY
jgi:hypothetical protein